MMVIVVIDCIRGSAVTTNALTVSEAAREIERRRGCLVRPRDISTLLYDRRIDNRLCPIIAGHRMISPAVLPLIEQALAERGVVPPTSGEALAHEP